MTLSITECRNPRRNCFCGFLLSTVTLAQVTALSDYMDLPSGKRLAFSVVGNSHPLKGQEGAATLDQITLAVYDWFSRHKK
jgi:hypothetical protein